MGVTVLGEVAWRSRLTCYIVEVTVCGARQQHGLSFAFDQWSSHSMAHHNGFACVSQTCRLRGQKHQVKLHNVAEGWYHWFVQR